MKSFHWRHNERHGVSNHQPRDCLLNLLSRRWSKETSKLRVTGLWAGNSPVTGEFLTQKASNAENASIWWRHHDLCLILKRGYPLGTRVLWILTCHNCHICGMLNIRPWWWRQRHRLICNTEMPIYGKTVFILRRGLGSVCPVTWLPYVIFSSIFLHRNKIASYQYRNSVVKDKTGIPTPDNTVSCWNRSPHPCNKHTFSRIGAMTTFPNRRPAVVIAMGKTPLVSALQQSRLTNKDKDHPCIN